MRVVTIARTRYEVVRDGCGTGMTNCKYADQHPLTVFTLKPGTNERRWGLTECVPGDQITNDEEIPDDPQGL